MSSDQLRKHISLFVESSDVQLEKLPAAEPLPENWRELAKSLSLNLRDSAAEKSMASGLEPHDPRRTNTIEWPAANLLDSLTVHSK